MRKIKIVGCCEEFGRYEDDAVLLGPGVAVMADRSTFYFIRVEPAQEPGFYVETESICDLCALSECDANIADIPEESIAFAFWIAGVKPLAIAG